MVNADNCIARKSKNGDGFNQQCPNKRKFGNYCGKHNKSDVTNYEECSCSPESSPKIQKIMTIDDFDKNPRKIHSYGVKKLKTMCTYRRNLYSIYPHIYVFKLEPRACGAGR